jgi:hypothetical protein
MAEKQGNKTLGNSWYVHPTRPIPGVYPSNFVFGKRIYKDKYMAGEER